MSVHTVPVPTSAPVTAPSRYVRRLDELRLGDAGLAGGKGANLGELIGAGVPVPPGFVVTVDAYLDAVDAAGVRAELRRQMAGLDAEQPADVAERARLGRALIDAVPLPPAVVEEVLAAYRELLLDGTVPVAVRSSAAGEDSAGTSFAGMNESFTNVSGEQDLLVAVRRCWRSLFGDRAMTYRASQGLRTEPAIAVVVQRMVAAERSGVMFTQDPTGHDRDCLVIEAAWGQGEVVVGGLVEPDGYVVEQIPSGGLALRRVHVGNQAFEIVRGPDGCDLRRNVPVARGRARVLDDAMVLEVARVGVATEAHYGVPQDVEWCTEGSKLWFVQSRPITAMAPAPAPAPASAPVMAEAADRARPLVTGLSASRGTATGVVRILSLISDGDRLQPGDVLVTTMTKPDWLPLMRRAAAVVTDGGGITCHAAVVCRELGIPCVVGARDATSVLLDGQLVTVDAERGTVSPGAVARAVVPVATPALVTTDAPAEPPLSTKIMVNLALPEEAERAARLPVDGVGLLRAELLLVEALGGEHPRALLADGRGDVFVTAMADALVAMASPFGHRPVIYRTTDLRTNEFRDLRGGDRFEPVEANPMIGYRGCARYLNEPDLFALELEAVARARTQAPNLHLMLPFVRTRRELAAVLRLIDASPLGHQHGLQRWIMAEVPSVVHWLPAYAGLGIHGVSIGSNDLTQLVLGVDRDSTALANLFDETDEAVLDTIGQIVQRAHGCGLTVSLCGQAPSQDANFARHLIRMGIDSISVNPDSVAAVRHVVMSAERDLVTDAVTSGRPGLPPL